MFEDIDDVTAEIIDAGLAIHIELGPGLLESVYQVVMASELRRRGLFVERHKSVPFEFRGMKFTKGLRVDLLVNRIVVVELKSKEQLAAVDYKQVLTYLRLLDLRVGLLMNFGEARFKDGLRRVVNGYSPSASPRLRVKK